MGRGKQARHWGRSRNEDVTLKTEYGVERGRTRVVRRMRVDIGMSG